MALRKIGALERIDLKLADGADEARVRNAVAAILPANAEIVIRKPKTRRTDSLSRAYRVNLDMLALMALLTAPSSRFPRKRCRWAPALAIALLRVLGVQRRAILIQVLAEGAVVGGIGAIVGLGLGLGLADVALRFLAAISAAAIFTARGRKLIFRAGPAAFGFLLLGVCGAARSVCRRAMRHGHSRRLRSKMPATRPIRMPLPGALIALALLIAGAVARSSLAVYAFRCSAMHRSRCCGRRVAAMPLLARILLAPLQRSPSRFRASCLEASLGRALPSGHCPVRHRASTSPHHRHGGDGVEFPRSAMIAGAGAAGPICI